VPKKDVKLKDQNPDDNIIWIRVGNDRGTPPSEYGPYSINLMKRLFKDRSLKQRNC
jgi:hypothetical protein